MFVFLSLVWIFLGTLPLIGAIRRRERPNFPRRVVTGVLVLAAFVVVLLLISALTNLAGELWWFEALGYGDRFWTEYSARILLFVVGAAVGLALFGGGFARLLHDVPFRRAASWIAGIIGALIGGVALSSIWQRLLLFSNRVDTGVVDPVFGLGTEFYLFALPLYGAILTALAWILVLYAVAAFFTRLSLRSIRRQRSGQRQAPRAHGSSSDSESTRSLPGSRRLWRQLMVIAGFLILIAGLQRLLDIPRLMYNTDGAVTGVGWLESNVLVPTAVVSAIVLFAAAVAMTIAAFSTRIMHKLLFVQETGTSGLSPSPKSLIAPVVVLAVLGLVNLVIPGAMRALVLDPNEITLESEYIPHHIEFTRNAYGLGEDRVDERRYEVDGDITAGVLGANRETLDNVRLWDWRALQDNLSQRQEIRLYYEFHDVDIDRYDFDGRTQQMMLSVRELEKSRLAAASQTWVSRHIKYTHGYGLVALPVNKFLPQGRPDLVVQNIPPTADVPRFEVSTPGIYYGERTSDHVYVGTTQEEFDYPSGDQNVYTRYNGEGGVPIGGLIRRLVYASRFDGYRQLFSGYLDADSRIMFRRTILRRAAAVAPFLRYDVDPYPVLREDGSVVYILDAYSTSEHYPYSRRYNGRVNAFQGINYVRNSVKVVIDAYDGTVNYYIVDPDDPMVQTYARVFPELFSPMEEMPDDLKDHISYPSDYLTAQAEIFSTYHMTDTQVFYQREDVWEFATERYRADFQSVEPYYVLMQYPWLDELEFTLMLPFTPSNKNVINAWMAGQSSYENYGRITVFTFPKGVEVLGPRQIEARIDQNTEMSRALSLWSQRGSEVIRGNLLTIPLFGEDGIELLYVEPIYLQAEDARLPEIKRVALADQSRVVWAEDFDTAIDRLLGELPATPGSVAAEDGEADTEAATAGGADGEPAPEGDAAPTPAGTATISRALELFREYRSLTGDGNLQEAGQTLSELEAVLERLGATGR